MENNNFSLKRILFGIVLLAIGLYFLAFNFNLVSFELPSYLISIPSAVILIGLLILIDSKRIGFGLAVTVFGIIWLIAKVIGGIGFWQIVIPFLIITIGIRLLFRSKFEETICNIEVNRIKRGVNRGEESDDKITDVTIFGGSEKKFVSQNFQGGEITAVFGGSEIDFSECKLAPGKHVLDVLFVFGGSTMLVPDDWNIVVDVVPIFGGFSRKQRRKQSPNEVSEGTLVIKGLAIFGGGEIKHY